MGNDNNFDIFKLLGLGSPDADEHLRDPIGPLSPTFNPLSALPHPLQSEITSSPSPSSSANTLSPALTEEEAEQVDALFKSLSPEFLDSLVAKAETPPDPAPEPPTTPFIIPIASSESPLPASTALFSPVTAYAPPSASPPTLKRPFSLMDPPDQPQEPVPGPSCPRPAKRPCTTTTTTFPGESSFQLDPNIAPLPPSQPTGQPMDKPRKPRGDYSACKCESGLTSKPARHWRVCPYNPEAGAQPFACEYCDKVFGREDNKKRHIKEYHPDIYF